MTGPTIGCIADDYTGGTDVAAAFRRQGLRTVLLFGPPDDAAPLDDSDHHISLLLKSGNFGQPDLLVRAATSETLS